MRHLLLCLVLACTASVWVMADDSSDTKGKSDTRTITGCLTQGDSAKEFKLTANDGSTWEVRSSREIPTAMPINHIADHGHSAHTNNPSSRVMLPSNTDHLQ